MRYGALALFLASSVAFAQDGAQPAGTGMRAYHEALSAQRLGVHGELSKTEIETTLREAEEALGLGRAPEASSRLVGLTSDPRFQTYASTEVGIAARFLLGDAYAQARAHEVARVHLRGVLENPAAWKGDIAYARRAVRRLVELAILDSHAEGLARGMTDLKSVPPDAPPDIKSELAYLEGRQKEASRDVVAALAAYERVAQGSRHWAQATYLAGLIHVEAGRYKDGENLFCKIADPKRTQKTTPVMADERFFAVRDLARLALGRVAHEGLRHDDARYYYYLVPQDSDRLAEALYESATTRYEKKDYDGARELLDQLFAQDTHHRYADEARILDAYVDLGRCKFPEADAKLRAFIKRYEPLLASVRTLRESERGLRAVLNSEEVSKADAASLSTSEADIRAVAALVRVDPAGLMMTRRLGAIREALGGLTQTERAILALEDIVSGGKAVRSLPEAELQTQERARETQEGLDGVRRALEDAAQNPQSRGQLDALRKEYDLLQRTFDERPRSAGGAQAGAPAGNDLLSLLRSDRANAERLRGDLVALRGEVTDAQIAIARDGMRRLDLRLSRLLRRARLGRIESVLGRKRALEVEVEAIAAGYLPKDAVDGLNPVRYLKDNEEYWPFEGDDWPDEFVGKER